MLFKSPKLTEFLFALAKSAHSLWHRNYLNLCAVCNAHFQPAAIELEKSVISQLQQLKHNLGDTGSGECNSVSEDILLSLTLSVTVATPSKL